MKVAVIANGEWDRQWGYGELNHSQIDLLIAADGGCNLAIDSGRIPDILIGDLDSVMQDSLVKCQQSNTEIIKYPTKKDETDLE